MRTSIITAFLLVLFSSNVSAETIDVYDNGPASLWAAILGAQNGDILNVHEGEYLLTPDKEIRKRLTIIAKGGPHNTRIEGKVNFQQQASGSVLSGFTLDSTNWSSDWGVYCRDCDIKITECIIIGHRALGVGISVFNAANNPEGFAEISHNVIHGVDEGSAIAVNGGNARISHNIIGANGRHNIGHGGGLYVSSNHNGTIPSRIVIAHNLIRHNRAEELGGAIFCFGLGHDSWENFRVIIHGNVIHGNRAANGGAIYAMQCYTGVTSNTIYDNQASESGGAIHSFGAKVDVGDSILWGNSAPQGTEVYLQYHPYTLTRFPCGYTNLEGGEASVYVEPEIGKPWVPGPGMIDADPRFTRTSFSFDHHLLPGSPCINMGSERVGFVDLDGDPIFMGSNDIGADEYVGPLSFEADAFSLEDAPGGTINFSLDAGPAFAGRQYSIFGSASGRAPETTLPGGLATIPLINDWFTRYIGKRMNTHAFSDFSGVLDGSGRVDAQLNVPAASGLGGRVFFFAYAVADPWEYASNPLPLWIDP